MTSSRSRPWAARALLALTLALVLATPGCMQNMSELREALGFQVESAPEPEPDPEPEPEPEPDAPLARAAANATRVVTGETVLFTADGTTDPGGLALTTYTWDFGDGHQDVGLTATHAYDGPGVYVATLTVHNEAGKMDTDTVRITVQPANRAPIADLTVAPASPALTGTDFNFSADASRDPEGGNLTYAWDFGDGATSTQRDATHAYERPGRYAVTLTVRDPKGLEDNATRMVTVEYDRNFTGKLSMVGADGADHTVPVAPGAQQLRLTLTFPTSYGANNLSLQILDANGTEVANTSGAPAPGEDGEYRLLIDLRQSDLASYQEGHWTARVSRSTAVEAEYELRVEERLELP